MPIDEKVRNGLLAMARRDREVREELAADGALFDGYHPHMEAVHLEHAERLAAIIDAHGWPGLSLVGQDGAEAAWMIAQHAISRPDLQRRALCLLREATERGEAPPWQVATLEDRIALNEGGPQPYGSQFDWDERGQMSPYPPIDDPEHVDDRRRTMGLGPLAEAIARQREAASRGPEKPPRDVAVRRQQMEDWARRVGWRR